MSDINPEFMKAEGWDLPGYSASVVRDSVSQAGKRIFSVQVTYPLIVHNELMTHRRFSRNSASSRAIPISKFIQAVQNSPFIPDKFYYNQKGMQPSEEMTPDDASYAVEEWLLARDAAVKSVQVLHSYGCAKEIANRLLGPFFWNTALVTSTEWCNFFNLRCHPMAQRQIRIIAEMIRDLYFAHTPDQLESGTIHAPYILDDETAELSRDGIVEKVSTARCARLSYLNHDGKRDVGDDLTLYARLMARPDVDPDPLHASPAEHVAYPLDDSREASGNFFGWEQFRMGHANHDRSSYIWNGIRVCDDFHQKEYIDC